MECLRRGNLLIVTIINLLASVSVCFHPHSSTLAWKIPWTEEPGRLQSMGSLSVGHNWATSLSLFTFVHWRRKWQPTPVFLPWESQGWGTLVGCHLWGRTESHRVGHDWSDLAAVAAAAYPFSSRSSWPRNWTTVSWITGRFFTSGATFLLSFFMGDM